MWTVRSTAFILLQGVPSTISLDEVREAILAVDGVLSVHELHVWQLSENKIVASVHVMASRKHDFMPVAAQIRKALHERGIHSSTIQPEYHPPRNAAPEEDLRVSPRCDARAGREHIELTEPLLQLSASSSCLILCPPDQECNPSENACCRKSILSIACALALTVFCPLLPKRRRRRTCNRGSAHARFSYVSLSACDLLCRTYDTAVPIEYIARSLVHYSSAANVGKLATNGCIAVSRCIIIPALGPSPRLLISPASRRAMEVTDWPSTYRSSPHVVSIAHSRCSAEVSDDEMTATRNSTRIACSVGGRLSAAATSDGSSRCRNSGSNGGERGVRGIVSTNVASRRGASMSIVAARASSEKNAERNFVGGERSRQRSTSRATARPALAAARAFVTSWRAWSDQCAFGVGMIRAF